ncbi:MAG: ankyrin repeat domain-containing protein [Planctomycetia bacterium]|nr:ankyrin repeat domain-containing protein [Planctomycetia bacterium]
MKDEFQQALESLRRSVAEDAPDLIDVVDECNGLACHYDEYAESVEVAESSLRELLRIIRTLVDERETRYSDFRSLEATALVNLSNFYQNHGKLAAAKEPMFAALKIARMLAAKFPYRYSAKLAWVLQMVGHMHLWYNSDEEAEAAWSEEFSIWNRIKPEEGFDPNKKNLAGLRCAMGKTSQDELAFLERLGIPTDSLMTVFYNCIEGFAPEETLIRSAYVNNLQRMETLLDEGVSPDVSVCNDGEDMPLLLYLAERPDLFPAARLLIERGASLDTTSQEGFTLAEVATAFRNIPLLAHLSEVCKESILTNLTTGAPIVIHAIANGHDDVVRYLLPMYGNDLKRFAADLFQMATSLEENALPIVQALAENGYDIRAACDDNWTALHNASRLGKVEVVRYLLKNGADVHQVGGYADVIPLHNAAASGELEIAKLLVAYGSEIHIKNKNGKMPCDLARARGHDDVSAFLESLE